MLENRGRGWASLLHPRFWFSISPDPVLHLFQLEPVFILFCFFLFSFFLHLIKNGFAICICQESAELGLRLSEDTNVRAIHHQINPLLAPTSQLLIGMLRKG